MVEEGRGCPGVAPQQSPVQGGAPRHVSLPHSGTVPGEVHPPPPPEEGGEAGGVPSSGGVEEGCGPSTVTSPGLQGKSVGFYKRCC